MLPDCIPTCLVKFARQNTVYLCVVLMGLSFWIKEHFLTSVLSAESAHYDMDRDKIKAGVYDLFLADCEFVFHSGCVTGSPILSKAHIQ